MEELIETSSQPGRLTFRKLRLIVPALVLVVVLFSASLIWYFKDQRISRMEQEHTQQAAELLDRFGIHITLIAINDTLGVIEVRYQIIEPNKAWEVGDGQENYPMLIAEKNGKILSPPPASTHHNHNIEAGRTHFFFISNQHGSLSPGDLVTVVLGDVKVKHFVAQ